MPLARFFSVLTFVTLFVVALQPAHGQDHFTGCLATTNNATIFIPDDVTSAVGGDGPLEMGDEVALFTDDGVCAGAAIWQDQSLVIAAAGTNAHEITGFDTGEPLTFRVWDASLSTEYEAEVLYETCDGSNPLCQDDGLYEDNVLFNLSEVETVVALPVELTTFDATTDGSSMMLRWETASEVDNTGFEVQHRAPDAVPDAWANAGFVEGNGNTTESKQYSYRLDDLAPGTHTFRLKQMDRDGSFDYSESVEIDVQMATAFELEAPYPNPFRQQATLALRVAESQHVDIVAYNQLGQHVVTLHGGDLEPNTKHLFRLAGQRLASGMYFIRIQGEAFNATERITLVR